MRSAGQATDSIIENPLHRYLAFPLIIRSPETEWGFGGALAYLFKVSSEDEDCRTSLINLATLYTQSKQFIISVNSAVFFEHELNVMRFQSSYSYYPDKFWGVGNYTSKDSIENFYLKQFYINPQFLIKQFSGVYIGANYELQNIFEYKFEDGNDFAEDDARSRVDGTTSGLGILIEWDNRNNSFAPDKGFFAGLNFTVYHKIFGSRYDFNSLTLDVRKFFGITKYSVLAMQMLMKFNNGDVAFRNLSYLGGPDMMRGYYKGRFADNDMLAYQAEFRQHLFWRFGATVFISTGQVADNYSDLSLSGFHFTYGGGIRIKLKKSERLNVRVDYGRGNHTHGLYVTFMEAF